MELAIFSVVVVALLLLMYAASRSRSASARAHHAPTELPLEEMFPLHCRHFPQIRQALSVEDRKYLEKRVSRKIQQQARSARLDVARRFLAGLQQDFVRLERLGRTVAALSPAVSRKLETERLWLGVRFRIMHELVRLRLATGSVSVPQLARLADLVGSLAAQVESAMAGLEQAAQARQESGLSA